VPSRVESLSSKVEKLKKSEMESGHHYLLCLLLFLLVPHQTKAASTELKDEEPANCTGREWV